MMEYERLCLGLGLKAEVRISHDSFPLISY